MLLGKRARPPMKRTTSMSEITLDLNVPPPDPSNSANPNTQREGDAPRKQPARSNCLDRKVLSSATIANRTRHSADFLETAESDFLRACSLCKRRLVPSRDIYMYRGDSAFCSQECRQQQMIEDERKEKRCLASSKQVVAQPSGSHQVTTTKGESVAAL